MKQLLLRFILFFILIPFLSTGGPTDTSQFSHLQLTSQLPVPEHIVICIFENKDFDEIVNSPSAPYINSLLQDSSAALFTQSFAIQHPSFPNYLDLFSGSDQGINKDTCISTTFTTDNLASELLAAGKSFASYCEDLPSAGYTGCMSGFYVKKHNAAVYWQGNGKNQIHSTSNLPFSDFPSSADFSLLPIISFVIPNKINDMHSGTIEAGDTWLQDNLADYIQWSKTNNSLFICTFDEDDSSSNNRIPTFFFGESVKGGTYSEPINHFSVLRTIEEMYNLSYSGNADTATTILDCWKGKDTVVTNTTELHNTLQQDFELFPTLIASAATVSFTIPKTEIVTIAILNTEGKQMGILKNEVYAKGKNSFLFYPKNILSASGIYFLRFSTQDEVITRKWFFQDNPK